MAPVVSLHHKLMCARDQGQAIGVVELLADVLQAHNSYQFLDSYLVSSQTTVAHRGTTESAGKCERAWGEGGGGIGVSSTCPKV